MQGKKVEVEPGKNMEEQGSSVMMLMDMTFTIRTGKCSVHNVHT
jgi:hypothetical protein